jgi:hypothetical protein
MIIAAINILKTQKKLYLSLKKANEDLKIINQLYNKWLKLEEELENHLNTCSEYKEKDNTIE